MNARPDPSRDYLVGLLLELRRLSRETTWVEFKENRADPEEIGKYISALSNSAALEGRANAYLIWGVQDGTHEIVGTTFRPADVRIGNEGLEPWLLRLLSPRPLFRFLDLLDNGRRTVLLEVPRATDRPVQFRGEEFIRVGPHCQRLKDHPQLERALWRCFDSTPFEKQMAAERRGSADILSLLDYPKYFELMKQPLPSDRAAILARLADEGMILHDDAGRWNITNLGAVLFSRGLKDFPSLGRKAMRVIVYDGRGRLETRREQVEQKGYASGFEGLIEYINVLLPRNEVIGRALRSQVPMYPEIAVRELVANALIHQDFTLSGAGPMVEIFDDRMEITNTGCPLVSTDRFLDSPPRSRNEALASFMRRSGICEERGSGVDKVVFQTEFFQLPAPIFETVENSTRVVLFAYKALRDMEREDRVRACYLHACLRHVERDPMTNSSLRARFGIEERNKASASRIIREALEDGRIKPYDPGQGRKYAKYLPFWA